MIICHAHTISAWLFACSILSCQGTDQNVAQGRSVLPVRGWQFIHEAMKAVKNQMLASTVSGGVIPLPRGVRLAEGMRVQIVPLDALPGDPPFLKPGYRS